MIVLEALPMHEFLGVVQLHPPRGTRRGIGRTLGLADVVAASVGGGLTIQRVWRMPGLPYTRTRALAKMCAKLRAQEYE